MTGKEKHKLYKAEPTLNGWYEAKRAQKGKAAENKSVHVYSIIQALAKFLAARKG